MRLNLILFARCVVLGLLVLKTSALHAESTADVLAYKKAPAGVVFEIVSGDEDFLEQALPKVRKDIANLRKRFPGLPIVVVSHGNEQFALTRDNRDDHENSQDQVQSLVTDNNVTFHVCGTYARMRNVDEDEFPDYVDVAPHGPEQIKAYLDLGYIRILVN